VRHIAPNLSENLPNLQTLVLTSNNVAELADLDPLRRLGRLTHLSLLENPVVRKEVRLLLFFPQACSAYASRVELSLLDNMANTFHPLPRFSESKGRRAGEGEGAFWH
jgi:Leucine-rich repeat